MTHLNLDSSEHGISEEEKGREGKGAGFGRGILMGISMNQLLNLLTRGQEFSTYLLCPHTHTYTCMCISHLTATTLRLPAM